MYGLRTAVVEALEAEFGSAAVRTWNHLPNDPIELTIRVRHQTPQWRNVPRIGATGQRLKGTDRRPVAIDVQLRIDVKPSTYVAGATKAEAAETFDRVVAEWVEWAKSYRLTACDHCDGTGAVKTQADTPTIGGTS
jgi:hypothetical protein